MKLGTGTTKRLAVVGGGDSKPGWFTIDWSGEKHASLYGPVCCHSEMVHDAYDELGTSFWSKQTIIEGDKKRRW